MNQRPANLKEVAQLAQKLSTQDKLLLIGLLAPDIENEMSSMQKGPRKSLLGLCADLGPAPSSEEIDEARRQEWANFPREGN